MTALRASAGRTDWKPGRIGGCLGLVRSGPRAEESSRRSPVTLGILQELLLGRMGVGLSLRPIPLRPHPDPIKFNIAHTIDLSLLFAAREGYAREKHSRTELFILLIDNFRFFVFAVHQFDFESGQVGNENSICKNSSFIS